MSLMRAIRYDFNLGQFKAKPEIVRTDALATCDLNVYFFGSK